MRLKRRRSSFGQAFILWEDGNRQIHTVSSSRRRASGACSGEGQSCLFIHWQKSLDISKYWKTVLKVTPVLMTLTLKYGLILFSCWNRQDQWCSACQRCPYWLEETTWLEFLPKGLGECSVSSHNPVLGWQREEWPSRFCVSWHHQVFSTAACPLSTTKSQMY